MEDVETLPARWQAKFDEMTAQILNAIGIKEGKDDIIVQCGSIRLRIYEAGEYERKDKPGEVVKYEPGVNSVRAV
jgi:hypothetical protein